MKCLPIAGLVSLIFASTAFAQQPFLVKKNFPGFTPPDWARTETCELYANRVVISKTFGTGHTITQTRPISLEGNMTDLIDKAAREEEESKPNLLCDGPSTVVEAKRMRGADTESVSLFSTGGCGSPMKQRTGVASQTLRDMIDDFCPTTHDFSRD